MHNKCEVNDDEMIQAELRVSSACIAMHIRK
jgi:hypothetical protein